MTYTISLYTRRTHAAEIIIRIIIFVYHYFVAMFKKNYTLTITIKLMYNY